MSTLATTQDTLPRNDAPAPLSLTRTPVGRAVRERIAHGILFLCGTVSILTTLGIVFVLLSESLLFFEKVSLVEFLTDTQWTPLFVDRHFGILPLVTGTVLVSLIAVAVALPMGLAVAIYLSEYASPRLRAVLKPLLEVLAGIPSIVYGYFALLVVTPLLQRIIPDLQAFNALGPGLVMGIMILPMVASLSEDALHSVPRALREGAFALGANRLQMIGGVLIPAALGGITASFILAISRAVGETMIVAIAAGQQPILTLNPLRSVETMTAYIVQVSLGDTPHGTIEYQTIFAVGAMLFLLTMVLNTFSIYVRERFSNRY